MPTLDLDTASRPAQERAHVSWRHRLARAARRASLSALPVIGVLLLWQLAVSAGWVRAIFLPPLPAVWHALVDIVTTPLLADTLGTSVLRALLGVALAAAIGVPAGFALAESRWLRWWCEPYVAFGYPLPKIALVPVFTVWFGVAALSKVMLVFATCLFPFMLAAQSGASLVPQKLRWAALALGTRPRDMFRRVILPASVPSLITGLRVAFPIGLITVFTAEMVSGGGLGEAIVQAQRYFQSAQVYAYVLLTMIVGYAADVLIAWLQRRLPSSAG
ncbi:ABC transporter permease [Chitinasiproducens palmae]|uniref:NitT/TauT family transport system permease protein n=1 Tax=Chitinasiproducens palmae TaxID=1770053 RepID=A0A1H2PUZ5_9BURK|nr:ABC transporter permease [Chitinasiproducens palmae]SDV50698.1 NitT/TauT family transport system permease protein [Chitinasiproducens palmae]